MADKVDTVIIGGGIGGAALGALLASGGQKVTLVEKNSIIGGRCLSYMRDGFVVDLGVHLFGESGEGPLGEVCKRAGEPDLIEWVLARNPRVAVHFKGETKPFTREVMMDNVEKKDLGPLANIFAQAMQMSGEELDKLWYVPLLDWLSQFTTDQSVHANFAMLCGIYHCVTPDVASTAEFILSLRGVMQKKSSGYPRGGCVAIPLAYQKIIEKHGGEAHLNCPAEKILIENGIAKGVVAGGRTIEADRVVSNADIKATIGGLASAEHFPRDYVKRVRGLEYTAHVVALKVALDKVITDQKMIMYVPDLTDEEIEELQKQYLEGGPMPYVAGGMLNSPTNFDPELAPPGKQLLFFGTRCERDQDWKKWEEIMLDALREMFPGIEQHILWTAVDSPDVIDAYAGEDGNVIGVGQTVDQIHERRPAHETPVKNLYLVGAEAGGHGIGTELAASSALELSEKLL
jgi:phytoene dehydrogenase-like protein